MTDVSARANALRELIEVGNLPIRGAGVEALVSCCEDLLFVGEAIVAEGLLDNASAALAQLSPEALARIDVVRAQVFSEIRKERQALAIAESLLRAHGVTRMLAIEDESRVRVCECKCLWRLNRVEEAVAKGTVLRRELLSRPDSVLLAACNLELSSAYFIRGDLRNARRFCWEAIVSARRSDQVAIEGEALANLAMLDRMECRWASSFEAAADAFAIFNSIESRGRRNRAKRGMAIILWKRGRLEEAQDMAVDVLRDAASLGIRGNRSLASLLAGLVRLHQGQHEAAKDCFVGERGGTEESGQLRPHLLAAEFLGDVLVEEGDAKTALSLYDEALPKAMALVPKGDIVAELRRRRAECFYLLDRHTEAYEEAQTGLTHCRELGDRYEEAATYRIAALSAAAIGKVDEAKQLFDQGFAFYDDIETPYEWGKLWLACGDWLNGPHAGAFADKDAALEAFHMAREHFERMGAKAKLAEANARIATMTAHATPDGGTGPTAPHPTASRRRRPSRATEADRRREWALEKFGVVTANAGIFDLLETVEKLARSRSPILVLGESGTGKELVAQAIHRLSGRAGQFMAINCGALVRDIVESELFGHVAGSFTGAMRDKAGLLDVCDGGTAFLDEVGEMSGELQVRLLRFLETGETRRVGATKIHNVDTRIVAATNRDRASLQGGGSFRQDLYYRLAHAVVEMPPLRRRGARDVSLLADFFLERAGREEGKQVGLSEGARARLSAYAWPGNVRELKSVITQAVVLSTDGRDIEAKHLALESSPARGTLEEELQATEKRRIEEALRAHGQSKADAARALKMPRTTLINKMRRHGLE